MSEIEKYYNGEIIVDFEEETELEKKYNEVAELYSEAVKKKIEYRKEIERLNNIINGTDEILKEHINECREELNTIMKGNDLDYINECSREFDVIRKNIEMIIEKVEELKGDGSNDN